MPYSPYTEAHSTLGKSRRRKRRVHRQRMFSESLTLYPGQRYAVYMFWLIFGLSGAYLCWLFLSGQIVESVKVFA